MRTHRARPPGYAVQDQDMPYQEVQKARQVLRAESRGACETLRQEQKDKAAEKYAGETIITPYDRRPWRLSFFASGNVTF